MKQITRLLCAAIGAATLAGCADSTAAGNGKLALLLTDAPFPFAEVARVDVHVVRIEARSETVDSATAANASARGGWITLVEPNATFNLLELQNGKTANLGVASLPTGTYNSFRLILDTQKSSVTLKDGFKLNGTSTPDIKWPSAAQTGIKIFLSAPYQATQDSSVMVLDFDVGQSFVLRGNSIRNNGLLFKPVIRATAREVTGTISGSVRGDSATGAAIAGASVELLKQGTALTDTVSANVLRTTSTDANGAFSFGFVLPGTYDIRATPPAASGYKPALSTGITLATGGTATRTVVVTK